MAFPCSGQPPLAEVIARVAASGATVNHPQAYSHIGLLRCAELLAARS